MNGRYNRKIKIKERKEKKGRRKEGKKTKKKTKIRESETEKGSLLFVQSVYIPFI